LISCERFDHAKEREGGLCSVQGCFSLAFFPLVEFSNVFAQLVAIDARRNTKTLDHGRVYEEKIPGANTFDPVSPKSQVTDHVHDEI
jgi:hypothetical protein